MSNKPDISIIIPLYNKETCIMRTINSVLSQSYQYYEIVIIDDGSKDSSAEYVKKIKDSRIKYYYKENNGVSSARNYGINKASNSWILFLDADDILHQDALEVFSRAVLTFSNMEVFIGGYSIQTNKSLIINECKGNGIISSPLKKYWHKKFFPRTGNTLIKKTAIDNLGLFDERISFNEDLYFVLKLLSIYRVVLIKTSVMTYTCDHSLLSRRKTLLESEFINYIYPLSLENKYINYLVYEHFLYSIKRRIELKDNKGKAKLINDRNMLFPQLKQLSNYIAIRINNIYRKYD